MKEQDRQKICRDCCRFFKEGTIRDQDGVGHVYGFVNPMFCWTAMDDPPVHGSYVWGDRMCTDEENFLSKRVMK